MKASRMSQPPFTLENPMAREIFVFGSNLAGRHGAGAALTAKNLHGAVYGKGFGLFGNSYAIPTKDGRGRRDLTDPKETLPLEKIAYYVGEFLTFAKNHPKHTFYITRIGCGRAGYKDEQIAPLFAGAPTNCILPEGWREMCNTDATNATNSVDTYSQTAAATNVPESCPKSFKLVIAGGRYFKDYDLVVRTADHLLANKITEGMEIHIVCGEAKGADALGKQYAEERGFILDSFPADWDKQGKSAGYRRNEKMAKHCDAVLAFWDGESKGTKHMIDLARSNLKPHRVVKY